MTPKQTLKALLNQKERLIKKYAAGPVYDSCCKRWDEKPDPKTITDKSVLKELAKLDTQIKALLKE